MIFKRYAKVVSAMVVVLMTFIVSCDDDEKKNDPEIITGESPGHIPGAGEEPGAPTGEPFVLPRKITVTSIVGEESPQGNGECVLDGSGFFVMVSITLKNDSTGAPREVVFPPGLVIVTAAEGFQNGLLVERVVVTVPPKTNDGGTNVCKATLLLNCLNSERSPSDATASYTLGPVTNSPLLKDFIQKLSTKKTLYSEYNGNDDFFLNQERIQDALWSLTDGDGLTETDLDHIKDLPNK
jgi:hypothetical protein